MLPKPPGCQRPLQWGQAVTILASGDFTVEFVPLKIPQYLIHPAGEVIYGVAWRAVGSVFIQVTLTLSIKHYSPSTLIKTQLAGLSILLNMRKLLLN